MGIEQGWPTFLMAGALTVHKFRRNSSACPRNFEEPNKVLGPSIIIINYIVIVIINTCYNYNYIINLQHNYHIYLKKTFSKNAIRKQMWK